MIYGKIIKNDNIKTQIILNYINRPSRNQNNLNTIFKIKNNRVPYNNKNMSLIYGEMIIYHKQMVT